jgi:trafficking protein particle complex subunit 13
VPRSPSALLSAKERAKVFLEVHIQNLTSEPMWFERIIFEPAPGWHVQDANLLPDSQESLFSGTMAMMQTQDMRQYVYILNEIDPPNIPVQHAPGTVLPLGRLDISWRSSFGEPGRLLTSVSWLVVFLAFFPSLSFRVDAIPSNTSSDKSTHTPTATAAACVCPPASPSTVSNGDRSFLPTTLTPQHATDGPDALSPFLALPQPPFVRPTSTT